MPKTLEIFNAQMDAEPLSKTSNIFKKIFKSLKAFVTLRQVEVKIKSVLENCLNVLPFVGTEIRSTHRCRHFDKKQYF
jgi:hypothetical protein